MDIHGYVQELENAFATLAKAQDISERNREFIRKLAQQFLAQNYSRPRTEKYITHGCRVARVMKKDFDMWTPDDVQAYLAWTHQQDRSPWTHQWYKVFLKRMMQYVYGMSGKDYPPLVS